jgi:exopolyphosphatase/guanosine-5'-triphosphate,3'-diphosphate pyrophosphatase
VQLIGTGGTTTILARMEARTNEFNREQIEKTQLSLERLSWQVAHLWELSLSERKKVIGLPENRADVILMGVAIYEAVMTLFGFSELRISTRGLRFAAVLS